MILLLLWTGLFPVFSDSSGSVSGSPSPGLSRRILSVTVEGNTQTRDYIILREVALKPGETVNERQIAYFADRIYSLNLFTSVTWRTVPESSQDGYHLIFTVTERWFWLVYPLLTIKTEEGKSVLDTDSYTNFSYGIGFYHTNIAGRNIFLKTKLQLGSDRFFSVNMVNPNPFYSTSLQWTFNLILQTGDVNKKLGGKVDNSRSNNNSITVSSGIFHRYSPYTVYGMAGEYKQVVTNGNDPDGRVNLLNAGPAIDQNVGINISWQRNTRNSSEVAMNGYLQSAYLSHYLETNTGATFGLFIADARIYHPLEDWLTLAAMVNYETGIGREIPFYHHSYVGKDTQIRGYQSMILQNVNRVVAKAELRTPLVTPYTFTIQWMPIDQFREFRWGLYASAFVDAGWVKEPGEVYPALMDYLKREDLIRYYERPLMGAGISFNLILPYSLNYKAEMAFNQQGDLTFWISSGTAF